MLSPAPKMASNEGVIAPIAAALGDALIEAVERVYEVSLTVQRDRVVEVLRILRDQFDYQQLMEIAGVDYPDRAERFEIVYHLLSLTKNHRVRVRVSTDEERPVPSVTGLWPVAGWLEREVYDMYGVLFDGNSDLRRILTDYGFRGHPFRKDFPLTGYVEMRYSDEHKRVIYEPVKLAQDFRAFDFTSPWEGAEYLLPGDEKAKPEAKGAPTPLTAEEIAKAGTITVTTGADRSRGSAQPPVGATAPAEAREPLPPTTIDQPESKNG